MKRSLNYNRFSVLGFGAGHGYQGPPAGPAPPMPRAPFQAVAKSVIPCEYCDAHFISPEMLTIHLQDIHRITRNVQYPTPAHYIPNPASQPNPNVLPLPPREFDQRDPKRRSPVTKNSFVPRANNTASNAIIHDVSRNPMQQFTSFVDGTDKNNPKPKKEKNYDCTECGKRFTSAGGVEQHRMVNHPTVEDTLPTRCEVCAKVFKTYVQYYQHRINAHEFNGVANGILNPTNNSGNKEGKFVHPKKGHPDSDMGYLCQRCNKMFQKYLSYVAHARTKHNELKNVHVCKDCDTPFWAKLDLGTSIIIVSLESTLGSVVTKQLNLFPGYYLKGFLSNERKKCFSAI